MPLQVLSDPSLKQLYDSGKDVSQDTDFMASGEFFAMLFGSTRFDEFVGELMISTVARTGEQEVDRSKVRMRFTLASLARLVPLFFDFAFEAEIVSYSVMRTLLQSHILDGTCKRAGALG